MPTATGVPKQSPIPLLPWPNVAYLGFQVRFSKGSIEFQLTATYLGKLRLTKIP